MLYIYIYIYIECVCPAYRAFFLLLAEQAKRVNRFKWWYFKRRLPNSDKTNQNQRHMTGMYFGFKPLSELL